MSGPMKTRFLLPRIPVEKVRSSSRPRSSTKPDHNATTPRGSPRIVTNVIESPDGRPLRFIHTTSQHRDKLFLEYFSEEHLRLKDHASRLENWKVSISIVQFTPPRKKIEMHHLLRARALHLCVGWQCTFSPVPFFFFCLLIIPDREDFGYCLYFVLITFTSNLELPDLVTAACCGVIRLRLVSMEEGEEWPKMTSNTLPATTFFLFHTLINNACGI